MSAFLLLIFSIDFTIYLYQHTKHSATIYISIVSVNSLRPYTFSVLYSNIPVSCYAFFKGWLLPSPPSGCIHLIISFPH